MTAHSATASLDRDALVELAPLLRRLTALDADGVTRLHSGMGATLTAAVRLPFGVLAARTVPVASPLTADVTVSAAEVLAWLEDDGPVPAARDAQWRWGLPPAHGWHRLDTVPDDTIRPLVRQGALALKDAAAREGVPGAQPRAEVADALLDAVVLTVDDADGRRGEVTLRLVSALTRLGFLPRGGAAHVDVAGRWLRLAGGYGSVYAERAGSGLDLA